jgi:hypothetical protein
VGESNPVDPASSVPLILLVLSFCGILGDGFKDGVDVGERSRCRSSNTDDCQVEVASYA